MWKNERKYHQTTCANEAPKQALGCAHTAETPEGRRVKNKKKEKEKNSLVSQQTKTKSQSKAAVTDLLWWKK